jgi:hypothetical protein
MNFTRRELMAAAAAMELADGEVVANTGFPLIIPEKVTEPPTQEQLRWIREVIDPDPWYTGNPNRKL